MFRHVLTKSGIRSLAGHTSCLHSGLGDESHRRTKHITIAQHLNNSCRSRGAKIGPSAPFI